VLAVDPFEQRAHRLHRSAGALVQRVRLQLDAPAAPLLERVSQHQELRLDVHAGSPDGRVEPRPADLDRQVLRPEGEKPRRADDALVTQRHERYLRAVLGNRERGRDPGIELLTGVGLGDRQPAPRAWIAGCLPQALGMTDVERLEPDEPAHERRCLPPFHGVLRLHYGPCRSTNTRA
jgi:hypothetical protein